MKPCLHIAKNRQSLTVLSQDDEKEFKALVAKLGMPVPFQTKGNNVVLGSNVNRNASNPIFSTSLYEHEGWRMSDGDWQSGLSVAYPAGKVLTAKEACGVCANKLACDLNGGLESWVNKPSVMATYFSSSCAFIEFANIKSKAMKEALADCGFEAFSQRSFFKPDVSGEYEQELAAECLEAGGINWPTVEKLEISTHLLESDDPFAKKETMANLEFDRALVDGNRLVSLASRHGPAVEAAKTRKFKKEECGRCLYACDWVRSDIENCHATEEKIFGDMEVTDADITWMTRFCFSGAQETASGKRRFAVWGPDKEDGYVVKNLSPPFSDSETYVFDHDPERFARLREQLVDQKDKLVPTLWALRLMSQHMRWEIRIQKLGGGSSSRNDILGIELRPHNLDIDVHSDTRASSDRYGGSSITVADMPRWISTFPHPYYETIHTKLGMTPGSGRRW
jgi:hypothetical protein